MEIFGDDTIQIGYVPFKGNCDNSKRGFLSILDSSRNGSLDILLTCEVVIYPENKYGFGTGTRFLDIKEAILTNLAVYL